MIQSMGDSRVGGPTDVPKTVLVSRYLQTRRAMWWPFSRPALTVADPRKDDPMTIHVVETPQRPQDRDIARLINRGFVPPRGFLVDVRRLAKSVLWISLTPIET
jgi:hypothetical protein